jgi:hypothetical protein
LKTGTAGAVEGSLGIPEAKKFIETFQQSMQAHVARYANHPLGAEIAAQQMARKAYGSAVPEVIGTTERGFIQEFAGSRLPESYVGKAYKEAGKHYEKILAHSGTKVVHYDLHPGNILRKGSKLSIIDWGLAAPTAVTPEIARTGKQMMDFFVKRKIAQEAPRMMTHTPIAGEVPAQGSTISRAAKPEELFRHLETATNKQILRRDAAADAARRKQRLNELQEAAQALPFKLNAQRRTSHGVDRNSRTVTLKGG